MCSDSILELIYSASIVYSEDDFRDFTRTHIRESINQAIKESK